MAHYLARLGSSSLLVTKKLCKDKNVCYMTVPQQLLVVLLAPTRTKLIIIS